MSNLELLESARSILHEDTNDYSPFLAIVDENSIMHYQATGLPFSGVYQGKQGFANFFDILFDIRIQIVTDQRQRFFAYETPEGHVISGGTNLVTNRITGLACEDEWLSFCTFTKDSKIARLSTFSDHSAFLRAMHGVRFPNQDEDRLSTGRQK